MYYVPEVANSSIIIRQAVHINTLVLVLQTRSPAPVSARGEEFLVATESAGSLFARDAYAYKFCLRRHVLSVDLQAVVDNLQAAWVNARPGNH